LWLLKLGADAIKTAEDSGARAMSARYARRTPPSSASTRGIVISLESETTHRGASSSLLNVEAVN
jgi:hypothetical protein